MAHYVYAPTKTSVPSITTAVLTLNLAVQSLPRRLESYSKGQDISCLYETFHHVAQEFNCFVCMLTQQPNGQLQIRTNTHRTAYIHSWKPTTWRIKTRHRTINAVLCVQYSALIGISFIYAAPTNALTSVYTTFIVSYCPLHVSVIHWPSSGLTA